jgi:hypothetical protein
MKRLLIRSYAILGVEGKPLNTHGMIKHCIMQTPPAGFSLEDVMKRVRIEKAPHSEGEIQYEDEDARNLIGIVQASKWGTYHTDIVDFVESVMNLGK